MRTNSYKGLSQEQKFHILGVICDIIAYYYITSHSWKKSPFTSWMTSSSLTKYQIYCAKDTKFLNSGMKMNVKNFLIFISSSNQ